MTIYCPSCAAKNIYSGVKPKECAICGEPMERKIEPRRVKQRLVAEEVIEYEEEEALDLQLDPRSIRVEKDNGFMTIGHLRGEGGAYAERGSIGAGPDGKMEQIREQTLKTLLGEKLDNPVMPALPPEKKPRSQTRAVPSRLPPPKGIM